MKIWYHVVTPDRNVYGFCIEDGIVTKSGNYNILWYTIEKLRQYFIKGTIVTKVCNT